MGQGGMVSRVGSRAEGGDAPRVGLVRRQAIRLAPAFGTAMLLASAAAAQTAPRQALLMPGKRTLTQRVLTRPGARLHGAPGAAAGEAVPAFSLFHIYARRVVNNEEWIEVGHAAQGLPAGWLEHNRSLAWRQTLVLSFTNPAGRERAMFFGASADLHAILRAPDLSAAARATRDGQDGRVVALEPETHIDFNRRFYLMPVLSAERLDSESGRRMTVMEVASAPAEPAESNDPLAAFRGAVVFVIDTTRSMQPYIDVTRQAIRDLVGRIAATGLSDRFRFGLIGFRDHMGSSRNLEYVTRVFATPDFASGPEAILGPLGQLRATQADNEGFVEDSIAGLKATLDAIPWAGITARFVILVTDASARTANDPRGATGLGIPQIRDMLHANGIATLAIHLLTDEGRDDHRDAEAQYQDLTRQEGRNPLYHAVPQGDLRAFREAIVDVTEEIVARVAALTGVPVAELRLPARTTGRTPLAQEVPFVAEAIRLRHLGRIQGATAPDIERSFTVDRDLFNPARPTFDIRVLLTRNQLSDLQAALQRVVDAASAGRERPETVFETIRDAALRATRDPARVGSLQRLGNAFGEYLDDLPYRSQIMELTPGRWLAMQSAGQEEILRELRAKLRLYHEYARTDALWVRLNRRASAAEDLIAIPLEQLP